MQRSLWPRNGKPVASKNTLLTSLTLLGAAYLLCCGVSWASTSKFRLILSTPEDGTQPAIPYTWATESDHSGSGEPATGAVAIPDSAVGAAASGLSELPASEDELGTEDGASLSAILRDEVPVEVPSTLQSDPSQLIAAAAQPNGTEETNATEQLHNLEFIPGKKRKCIIGVASSVRLLETLSLAALQTWIPLVENICDVRLFVGRGHIDDATVRLYGNRIVQLDVEDAYPPLEKVFSLWNLLSNYLDRYEWFAKVDSDTYVHVARLRNLVTQRFPKYSLQGYFGIMGRGAPRERGIIGIKKPYCLGMGYFVGRETLRKVGPHFLHECMSDHRTNHSDTEVGRCVERFTGLGCATSPISFINMYWHMKNGTIHGVELAENKQLAMDFPEFPPKAAFDAAMVHPLKSVGRMHNYHRQVMIYLRPVFPTLACAPKMDRWGCGKARLQIGLSCVNNPLLQLEMTKGVLYLKECPTPRMAKTPNGNLPVFILSLDTIAGQQNFEATQALLLKATPLRNIQRFNSVDANQANWGDASNLTPGEHGYRDSMLRLFRHARDKKYKQIIVLDDDVKPHRQFTKLWEAIMDNPRCGGHMWAKQGGGVLMLGDTVWQNGTFPTYTEQLYSGWNMFDADIANATRMAPDRRPAMCYNFNQVSGGSFAGMYHQSTYDSIIGWLEREEIEPFDHVLGHLARLGHIVRVAYPNLFMADITQPSTINPTMTLLGLQEQLNVHRWKIDDYVWM